VFKKTEYANGQKVFAFEGQKLTFYFKTGIVKSEGMYENDQMQGEWIFYRETGQLWQVGNFMNGQKHGSWVRYDKDGNVEYNETFEHGKQVKNK
jgi:antitoxin component YwqK of YwqJK toxin-antitoxin module